MGTETKCGICGSKLDLDKIHDNALFLRTKINELNCEVAKARQDYLDLLLSNLESRELKNLRLIQEDLEQRLEETCSLYMSSLDQVDKMPSGKSASGFAREHGLVVDPPHPEMYPSTAPEIDKKSILGPSDSEFFPGAFSTKAI